MFSSVSSKARKRSGDIIIEKEEIKFYLMIIILYMYIKLQEFKGKLLILLVVF